MPETNDMFTAPTQAREQLLKAAQGLVTVASAHERKHGTTEGLKPAYQQAYNLAYQLSQRVRAASNPPAAAEYDNLNGLLRDVRELLARLQQPLPVPFDAASTALARSRYEAALATYDFHHHGPKR